VARRRGLSHLRSQADTARQNRGLLDVAGLVAFLASPAASLITGATLMVDGGWTIQ